MELWLHILLIVIALIVIAGGNGVAVVLDMNAETFECKKCGTRFVPSTGAYIAGSHAVTTRKRRCP